MFLCAAFWRESPERATCPQFAAEEKCARKLPKDCPGTRVTSRPATEGAGGIDLKEKQMNRASILSANLRNFRLATDSAARCQFIFYRYHHLVSERVEQHKEPA